MSFSFVEEKNVVIPDVNALDDTLLTELLLHSEKKTNPY
jgi:hypothetical protein